MNNVIITTCRPIRTLHLTEQLQLNKTKPFLSSFTKDNLTLKKRGNKDTGKKIRKDPSILFLSFGLFL